MNDLAGGTLDRLGLLGDGAAERAGAAVARIEADGIETVRFVFSDPHGVLRGKALVAAAAPRAFRHGVTAPSSLVLKDTSHRTVFPIWSGDSGFGEGAMTSAGDMRLVPDPASYVRLPWSPHSAWILCDLVQADGRPIPFAPRTVLDHALDRLHVHGLEMIAGLEVEFHIFRAAETNLAHAAGGMAGEPAATEPLNHGYSLLSDTAYAQAEDILDLLRRTALEMGLPVCSAEIELGPSQVEFTFDPAPVREHADTMVLFRAMTRQVCARQGLVATFMCRPVVEHADSSGWHLHQSLVDRETGQNRFVPDGPAPTELAGQWIAGLLAHAAESCLMTTPTVNGYRRFQPHMMAPDRIQWGRDNRGAMLRALMQPGDPASRIENRVAEPAANPHYALAAQIACGLAGVERGLTPPPPVEAPYDSNAPALPTNLGAAIDAFEAGTLHAETFGEAFARYLVHLKRAEWQRYLSALSDWERREYSNLL